MSTDAAEGAGTGALASQAPPPDARLNGLLALGLLVGTVNGLSRVTLPLFAAALGAQAWQVGIVGGLGYAGMLLLGMPMGAWIEHHGSRSMFARGVAAAAALYLLMPLLQSPWQAIVGAWLLGLTMPFRIVTAHTEFLALVPRLSAAKAGWNRAVSMLGMFFLGPALAAAVIALLGFAAVFQLAAVALLVALLLGRRVLGDEREPHTDGATVWTRIGAQIALLRQQAEVRRTIAIDFFVQMALAYFVVFALILAVRRFDMSLQAAAGLVTLQGAFFVVTLFFGGAWLARWNEDQRYLIAFVLLGAQGLLYGLGQAPSALWLGSALMGVGVGAQGLVSVTRFAELMRAHGRGRVGGLTSLGPPAGGVLGAMLGGVVSQLLGTEAGFLMLAAAYAALGAMQWRRLRRAAPLRAG